MQQESIDSIREIANCLFGHSSICEPSYEWCGRGFDAVADEFQSLGTNIRGIDDIRDVGALLATHRASFAKVARGFTCVADALESLKVHMYQIDYIRDVATLLTTGRARFVTAAQGFVYTADALDRLAGNTEDEMQSAGDAYLEQYYKDHPPETDLDEEDHEK